MVRDTKFHCLLCGAPLPRHGNTIRKLCRRCNTRALGLSHKK